MTLCARLANFILDWTNFTGRPLACATQQSKLSAHPVRIIQEKRAFRSLQNSIILNFNRSECVEIDIHSIFFLALCIFIVFFDWKHAIFVENCITWRFLAFSMVLNFIIYFYEWWLVLLILSHMVLSTYHLPIIFLSVVETNRQFFFWFPYVYLK